LRGCALDRRPNKCVRDIHLPADAAWRFYILFAILCPTGIMRSMIPKGWTAHTRKFAGVAILKQLEAEFCVDALNEASTRSATRGS